MNHASLFKHAQRCQLQKLCTHSSLDPGHVAPESCLPSHITNRSQLQEAHHTLQSSFLCLVPSPAHRASFSSTQNTLQISTNALPLLLKGIRVNFPSLGYARSRVEHPFVIKKEAAEEVFKRCPNTCIQNFGSFKMTLYLENSFSQTENLCFTQ